MIVVVIIGMLAVMAIPIFQRLKMNSRNAAFMNDLRTFAAACEYFVLDSGTTLPDGNSGTVPAGMAGYLKVSDYIRETPLGGSWDTESNSFGIGAAVGVAGYTCTPEQLALLEDKFDDGNTATGRLRLIGSGRYYWILDE
jgi:type II secretory pathway pseudopilin PulG